MVRDQRRTGTKPSTLSDVAALAGVAVSTASRALANPARVNVATRQKIERAADQLRYVSNSSARALTSGRTQTVAVVVPDITNPFYFDIIRGTQRQLRAAGYTQVLVDTEESTDLEEQLLAKLQRSCDGAVLAATRLPNSRVAAINQVLPLVTINRPSSGLGSVVIDPAPGIVQAVEHLVSLGHRHIVYVSGPRSSWSNERRWRAIGRTARRLLVKVSRTAPIAPRTTSGAAAADAALNTGATACVAFNDLVAIGMLARFRQRGIGVPADISVVGCDDIFGASFCNPALTTLTAPIEEAGRAAVSLLLTSIGSTISRSTTTGPAAPASRSAIVLPTHLTVRETTGSSKGR